jgi:hypothetical protein
MVRTGGKDYSEPLWHKSVLLATFIENGEEAVHVLSKGHEGYDKDETDEKFYLARKARDEKGLGPPLCATIAVAAKEGKCSIACETCPHRDAGKTPLYWATSETAQLSPPTRVRFRDFTQGGAPKPSLRPQGSDRSLPASKKTRVQV